MMRRLAGPVALLAGLAFLAVNGSAAYRTSHYTYNDSTCHKRSDPVNLILSGPNATAGYVGDRVYLVTGWNSHSGSTQRFLTGGKCSKMDGQLASGTFGRYHVRWNRLAGRNRRGQPGVSADPHHEDWACALPPFHAVDKGSVDPAHYDPTDQGSGFDQGRRELIEQFGGKAGWANWGNTKAFKQCDGDWAGSDGWTAFVQMG
jgi:hypothetical protein